MIQQAFCVFDRAAQAYFPPVFFPTMGLAERWFADMASNPEMVIHKHPGDHELFHVGEFDAETGDLRGRDKPSLVATAIQVLSLRQVANE